MTLDIQEKLKMIFAGNGYIVYDDEVNEKLEVDSLQFLSILCDIESQFDIAIPDEFLINDDLCSYNDVMNMVTAALKGK